MCEGDDLVAAREHNIMLTDDGAAAHCLDSDLLWISCDSLGGTVIFIMIAVVEALIDGISKGDGGSTRGVDLAVVVLL